MEIYREHVRFCWALSGLPFAANSRPEFRFKGYERYRSAEAQARKARFPTAVPLSPMGHDDNGDLEETEEEEEEDAFDHDSDEDRAFRVNVKMGGAGSRMVTRRTLRHQGGPGSLKGSPSQKRTLKEGVSEEDDAIGKDGSPSKRGRPSIATRPEAAVSPRTPHDGPGRAPTIPRPAKLPPPEIPAFLKALASSRKTVWTIEHVHNAVLPSCCHILSPLADMT